jgi:small subunit ribosomal protein S4
MVSHGHITVNGKKINVASHNLREGDVVAVREGSKKSVLFTDMATKLKDYNCPNWLTFNIDSLSGKVQGKPKNIEGFIDLNTVLEFYSR